MNHPLEQLTIVTVTLGDNEQRLRQLYSELQAFTYLPFAAVICDDGTNGGPRCSFEGPPFNPPTPGRLVSLKRMQNPGPMYGVATALNFALSHVTSEWAYLVEDGLRPSWGWLETAVAFIEQLGNRSWGKQGYRIGIAGFTSLQDWMLVMGGAMRGSDVMDVFHGNTQPFREFRNDGLWCWERLLDNMHLVPNAESDVAILQSFLQGTFRNTHADGMHITNIQQAMQKWQPAGHGRGLFPRTQRWPQRRTAYCSWYPGAFMLINMRAWKECGGFREGCTFFEGHLGIRMAEYGYLSVYVEGPPWLHCPSQCFKEINQHPDRFLWPRDHRDTNTVFKADFGYNELDAPIEIADRRITPDEQAEINDEFQGYELPMLDQWRKYL